jgi:hypothetical protein
VYQYPLVGVKKDEVDKALAHFENNAPRMRYKWFRSRGLFAGSGVVEAGGKTIVAQRLKLSGMRMTVLSGMRWTVAGADAIIALRCREASTQWEEIWQRPRNQTATA